jgi:hypothetical protein
MAQLFFWSSVKVALKARRKLLLKHPSNYWCMRLFAASCKHQLSIQSWNCISGSSLNCHLSFKFLIYLLNQTAGSQSQQWNNNRHATSNTPRSTAHDHVKAARARAVADCMLVIVICVDAHANWVSRGFQAGRNTPTYAAIIHSFTLNVSTPQKISCSFITILLDDRVIRIKNNYSSNIIWGI